MLREMAAKIINMPGGNNDPFGKSGGNIADEKLKQRLSTWTIWEGFNDGYIFTAPVGSFKPNDLGLFDMTGNVWEWCMDWYDEDFYKRPRNGNPDGPLVGTQRVSRGGAWGSGSIELTCSRRNADTPEKRNGTYGFRCAKDLF